MKKFLLTSALSLMTVFTMSSFTSTSEEPAANEGTKITITTDANGEVCDVKSNDINWDDSAWHIRDLRGYTNIRNNPNGKVCMRLKANTQYDIYAAGSSRNGWLPISSIYNLREGYWVRLHSSSTGRYWISLSVIY